ncbi:rhodanese-like domain-containing protein [Marimonas lutisalis]|uniref:rhodanese-like domain-containing protein n=1 Tax=Marimonas lutisalis TaxID=2545756 RepID=UPI0010F8AD2E|nr:rhodanese-like domain-containing protein [Marimonas lutisalis]
MKSVIALVAASFMATAAFADEIPEKKRTTAGLYVTSADVGGMLENPEVRLIDIRSRAEVSFLGLPVRANKHIPYMVMPMIPEFDAAKGTYKLELNPNFPSDFESYAQATGILPETPIILMCRSGSRSARAADLLYKMGYRNVYSLVDGYEGDKVKDGPHKGERVMNGWRNAGLAWSYMISDAQAYDSDL